MVTAMKKRIIQKFTLMELLVSMAVFTVLLVLLMQFFSGAQKVWSSSEQKSNMYADARVAMDMIATLLQNTYNSDGGVPFELDRGDGTIYFASQTHMELKGENDIRFFKIAKDGNKLVLRVFADDLDSHGFSYCFPPFDTDNTSSGITSRATALTKVKNVLDSSSPSQIIDLLDNVTGFAVYGFAKDDAHTAGVSLITADLTTIPYLIEFSVKMLSAENFKRWKDICGTAGTEPQAAKEFRLQHEYTFRRAVFLGNRETSQ